MSSATVAPPYGKRQSWKPKGPNDFGDGGAYPEIHIFQYPLGIGSKPPDDTSQVLAIPVDSEGQLDYSAVLTHRSTRAVTYTKHEDHKPKWTPEEYLQKPSLDEEAKLAAETEEALRQAVALRANANPLVRAAQSLKAEDTYIRYVPDKAAPGYNPNCAERIIRMVEKVVDPLEPPKFKMRRAPHADIEPPAPIQRAPPKKLTEEEKAAWSLPPCVSNWKNQHGYTIPLDMRLQADGRGLQEVTISSRFASFAESLYVAERMAREEIRLKNDLLKQKRQLEEQQREEKLREIAAKARADRTRILRHEIQADSKPAEAPAKKRHFSPDPSPERPPVSPKSEPVSRSASPKKQSPHQSSRWDRRSRDEVTKRQSPSPARRRSDPNFSDSSDGRRAAATSRRGSRSPSERRHSPSRKHSSERRQPSERRYSSDRRQPSERRSPSSVEETDRKRSHRRSASRRFSESPSPKRRRFDASSSDEERRHKKERGESLERKPDIRSLAPHKMMTMVERLERERRKEIEREYRLERAGRRDRRRRLDSERDISERVALGVAQPTRQEALVDTRLFMRDSQGPDITTAHDGEYAIYDKPLLGQRDAVKTGLYHFDKDRIRRNVGRSHVPEIGDSISSGSLKPIRFERV